MRTTNSLNKWAAAVFLAGLAVAPLAEAKSQKTALRKAGGVYDVTVTASGSAPGFGSRQAEYQGVLRLPKKRGTVVIRSTVEGRPVNIRGKIRKSKVRRGGKVVTYTGTTRIPSSALSAIPSDLASQDPDDSIAQLPASIRSLIPDSLLNEFRNGGVQSLANSLTAPLRATVSLQGSRPKVTATASLSAAGASGNVRIVGTKR